MMGSSVVFKSGSGKSENGVLAGHLVTERVDFYAASAVCSESSFLKKKRKKREPEMIVTFLRFPARKAQTGIVMGKLFLRRQHPE